MGLEAIEWASDGHVPPGDIDAAALARRATEDAGLTVASYGSYLRAGQTPWESFAPVLESALALRALNIRIWAGQQGVGFDAASNNERRAAAVALRRMAETASAEGLTISLEFHHGTLTDCTAGAVWLLTEVAHPALFTYWQPRPGLPLEQALAEAPPLASRQSHLHVFQWYTATNRFPLAEGRDYWRAVLARIRPSPSWPRPACAFLEFVAGDDPAQLGADATVLRELLDAA